MMRKALLAGALPVVLLGGALTLTASTITLDENGMGVLDNNGVITMIPFTVGQDPMAGGSATALLYMLPSSIGTITPGGLDLLDGGIPDDVIRFETGNIIAFYSAAPPPSGVTLSLADHTTPPTPVPNTGTANEVTTSPGNDMATYTPTAIGGAGGGPQGGFSSADVLTYVFISDVSPMPPPVPEPGTLAMMASAGLLLIGAGLRRRASIRTARP